MLHRSNHTQLIRPADFTDLAGTAAAGSGVAMRCPGCGHFQLLAWDARLCRDCVAAQGEFFQRMQVLARWPRPTPRARRLPFGRRLAVAAWGVAFVLWHLAGLMASLTIAVAAVTVGYLTLRGG